MTHRFRPATALGIIAVILLPSVAIGAMALAANVGQLGPLPARELIDDLSTRNLAYWFITLAVVSIGSWTWIVRWLLGQLESQRASNIETNKMLIGYMERDHADMRTVLGRTTEVLERALHRIEGK